jgi:ABC-type phosphate transport system substrate-binding protein
MIGKWRRLLALGGSLGAALALVSAVPAQATTGGGPTPNSILGSGSDTTQLLMHGLDGLYILSEGCAKFTNATHPLDFSCIAPDPAGTILSENYQHDQVHEADFLGSSTGVKQLCTQGQAGTANIDFARSSRGPKQGDCTGLHFVAYARDGISIEANDDGTAGSGINAMNNPDPLCAGLGFCLTQAQIQGVYKNCTITNWSQVGGRNLTMQIYTPQSGSGTRSQFETFVGTTDSSACITKAGQPASHFNVPENQNTGIAAADKTTAIFPFSFAIFSTEINNAGGYRLSSIDGVAPTPASIGCLIGPPTCTIFPYSRYVYNVICSSNGAGTCGTAPGRLATEATANYVGEEGWICKPSTTEDPNWLGAGTPPVGANASNAHGVSPHFATNWQTLIANKISALGFAPLGLDTIGGGDINSDHCRLSTT